MIWVPNFKPIYQIMIMVLPNEKNIISNDFTLQHNITLNFSLFLFFKINIICLPYWTFINRIHFTSYGAIVGFGKLLGIWKCSSNPKKRLEYYCHKLRETRLMSCTMNGKFCRLRDVGRSENPGVPVIIRWA